MPARRKSNGQHVRDNGRIGWLLWFVWFIWFFWLIR